MWQKRSTSQQKEKTLQQKSNFCGKSKILVAKTNKKEKRWRQKKPISAAKENLSREKKQIVAKEKKIAGENKMFLRQYIYNKSFVKFENL